MAAALGLPFAVLAAPPPAPPMAVRQVRGSIYEVTGGAIDNTGFYIGAKEVLVIDAKMTTEATREMVSRIRKLTGPTGTSWRGW